MTMTSMKQWMQAATPVQQFDLAKRAGTSRNYLYHLAGNFRDASAELAQRIERACLEMHKETKGALPKVYRTDLNNACRGCDFAQKCLGQAAVASEFNFIASDDTEGGSL
jgi:transcriptional regulator with XRE-family HTH domain